MDAQTSHFCIVELFEMCAYFSRSTATADARAYQMLVRRDLAVRDVISWHHLPMLDEESGELELALWPVLEPDRLAS